MNLLFASEKTISLQRIEKGVYGSVSKLDSKQSFCLLDNLVSPHGLDLNKPEYEYVEKILGEALNNSLFEGFAQFFTSKTVLY